jgi:hypothetical protein
MDRTMKLRRGPRASYGIEDLKDDKSPRQIRKRPLHELPLFQALEEGGRGHFGSSDGVIVPAPTKKHNGDAVKGWARIGGSECSWILGKWSDAEPRAWRA